MRTAPVKRTLHFLLICSVCLACAAPLAAQRMTPEQAARQSRKQDKKHAKMLRKANKKQAKATRKFQKAERKQTKKANKALQRRRAG